MKLCSNCNHENKNDADFCDFCGENLITERDSSRDLFVGEKSDYYKEKWEKADQKNGRSINYAAFFFSFLWLGYRKYYLPIALSSVGFLLIDFIVYLSGYQQPLFSTDPINTAINAAVAITFALYGNILYKRHVDKQIQLIDESTSDGLKRKEQYIKKGGTSWLGAFIAILIFTFVYVIPSGFIPKNVNTVEEIQYSLIQYTEGTENNEATIDRMFDNIFNNGEWTDTEKSATGKDLVTFEGERDGSDFFITFHSPENTDSVEITDFLIDGEDLENYTDLKPYDYLISLYN